MKQYRMGMAGAAFICIGLLMSSWKTIPAKTKDIRKTNNTKDSLLQTYTNQLYQSMHLDSLGLAPDVFKKAIIGFLNLRHAGLLHSKEILSIADFDQESTKKRLYILDLEKKELLLNTWVAHGENSGGNVANKFSNRNNSNQSSLGFYLTAETYYGKHGKSLRLDGLDLNFNSQARSRAIVLHGADYVSQASIDKLGRLGRSQGCPAVPSYLAATIINTLSDRTVLFIHASGGNYSSNLLNSEVAYSMIENKEPAILASVMD
ncbi:murein L,D-transpeptidase catalytic domain family protein [Pedobacter sp. MW01-1-1]|uniref:murein L,D-transpeptidase catalytic domain family protein n=1 Tax=Pedobacter sp. MW01-1-1 TaxID=3383027 RepID=UPI003FEF119E